MSFGSSGSTSETKPGWTYLPQSLTRTPQFLMDWLGAMIGMPTGQKWVPNANAQGPGAGGKPWDRSGGGTTGARPTGGGASAPMSPMMPSGTAGGGAGSPMLPTSGAGAAGAGGPPAILNTITEQAGLKGGGKPWSRQEPRGTWEPTYTSPEDTWFNPYQDYEGDLYPGEFMDFARNWTPQDYGAGQELYRTLAGEYLGPNEYLDKYISAAQRPVMEQWESSILPGIKTEAARAGALTSDAYGRTVGEAGRDLSRTLGDISANIMAPAYEGERGRQMAALGLAPQIGAMPLEQMRSASDMVQGYLDRVYNEWTRKYESYWRVAQNIMGLLSSILGGSPGGSSKSSGFNFGLVVPE